MAQPSGGNGREGVNKGIFRLAPFGPKPMNTDVNQGRNPDPYPPNVASYADPGPWGRAVRVGMGRMLMNAIAHSHQYLGLQDLTNTDWRPRYVDQLYVRPQQGNGSNIAPAYDYGDYAIGGGPY